jgi:nicotinate-nucleotide--dimethylbenzimidazole phosphoribosyltransferase
MIEPKPCFPPPDESLRPRLQHKIDRKTKPLGALGRLETLALQIGLIQQSETPFLVRPHIMVFASDHGAARAGVSAYPPEVSWQMVENFLAGGAAINVFCRQAGLGLAVVDAGIDHDFAPRLGLIDAKQGHGTANYLETPAMSRAAACAALEHGARLVRELSATGCNAVGLGEMGIGNTASATLLTHCLTGIELGAVTGRGSGLSDAGLARKRALLEQALARGGRPADPLAALSEYGGFEIAMMAGAMLGGAERRMVLVIDGFIATAALLVAHALAPQILPYCVFAHCSDEAGHARQLAWLGVEPLLRLDLRLGEGSGAALAFPLLQAAVGFLDRMASFEDTVVSERTG